jgi:hypothetical protein
MSAGLEGLGNLTVVSQLFTASMVSKQLGMSAPPSVQLIRSVTVSASAGASFMACASGENPATASPRTAKFNFCFMVFLLWLVQLECCNTAARL